MAQITSANLGNGNGSYTTDIVVKDMDIIVTGKQIGRAHGLNSSH